MAEKKFVTVAVGGGGMDTREASFDEANVPTSDQKAALAGTSGTPSMLNKYVTETDSRLGGAALVGTVIVYADDVVPTGYLECDGAAISRTTYADLFAILGTTWGSGDGSTTFNLPDFRGEFLRGWDHGRGKDPGRVFASAQYGSAVCEGLDTAGLIRFGNYDAVSSTEYLSRTSGNSSALNFRWYTLRPDNKAVLFAIKY